MLREGIVVYVAIITIISIFLLPKGVLPLKFGSITRWASLVWLVSSLYFLGDVGGLMSKHFFIFGILPAIYTFILSDLVLGFMIIFYFSVGWPGPLRQQYLKEERQRLEKSFQQKIF